MCAKGLLHLVNIKQTPDNLHALLQPPAGNPQRPQVTASTTKAPQQRRSA
jgi:hypothetical protein